MKKESVALPTRIKVNIIILMALMVLFAVLPMILLQVWFPNGAEEEPDYAGYGFSYIVHDICPCHAGDDDCSGYYACGEDKADLTYNLDNAPEKKLEEAKRDDYFEKLFVSNNDNLRVWRWMLVSDICYLVSFLSFIACIIYGNHNKAKLK